MEVMIFVVLNRYIKKCFLFILFIPMGFSLINPPMVFCRSPNPVATPYREDALQRDNGIKYIRNYSRKDYDNQAQNWGMLQDNRGIIYVANHGGLMEFDGVSWREIQIPNKSVRSLAMDKKGIIYIGGINEIGFLAPDSKGALKYVSLMAHLDVKYRNFSSVWRTYAVKEGIYFCTSKFLFLWDSKKIICRAKTDSTFAAPYLYKGKLYVRQNGVGLLEMKKGSLELIPGGEAFSSMSIYMLAEYAQDKLLIGTGPEGFYLYDKGNVTPFETDALDYIKNNKLSCGLRLSSGDFALATRDGGLVIIDSNGSIKYLFDKSSGLPDDSVKYVYEDFQGNLWLCLGAGISKIEYASPIFVYNDHYDLPRNVLSVVRHQGKLYAGTTRGLFFFEPVSTSPSPGKFRPVPGISDNCRSLISTGDYLLAAADKGVFQIEKDKKRNITSRLSFTLYRSQINTNRIWLGTRQGLVSLYLHSNSRQWTEECKFESIDQEIISIAEDKQGNLWLGTRTKGALKVDFPSRGTITHPKVTIYDSSRGLPAGEINVFWADNHVMFATLKGIFRPAENKKGVLPDYTFGQEFAGGRKARGVFRIVEDSDKNVWFHSMCRNIQAIPQSDGTFFLNKKPFARIPKAQVNTIYPDPDRKNIWFANVDGLIRYNTNLIKNYDLPFQALIREAAVNGMPLFYDAEEFKYKESKGGYWQDNYPVFPYKARNFCFKFAAPFFEGESETLYRCLLEGYDADWSAWTGETKRDYTNLDPGPHKFRVQAKNVYGSISSEAVFQFKVLPPWYRTWWALLVYALTALLVMYLGVKWRSRKLEQEKQTLEQIIKERTAEINDQKHRLQEQAEKLKEMDKVKSRFFANISHEFRTPLTLIMGPLEQMIPKCPEKEQKKKLGMMLRNSQRLLGLINQLLELSKFDSGKAKLKASLQNMIPFLKGITSSFEILALKNELDLTFHAENDEEEIEIYIDPEKIEDVMCNLLVNAVKFTPAGGKITVTVKKNSLKEADFPSGSVDIAVCDTGPGIPREQLSNIFDRFYQSESTFEHHRKGSGIGLAIAKELVELHHGRIQANSCEGKGTELIIRLPMGDTHLKPGEITGSPAKSPGKKQPGKIPALPYLEDINNEEEIEMENQVGRGEKNIILVVEDSADMREYIKASLEPLYAVETAKDGREGIQKAGTIIPDLIISDIMMPGTDGYELCRVLKRERDTSHIPIILLTAKAGEECIIQGLETGADDYITKPFSTKLLCARIKNLIDLRRQWHQTIHREMTLRPVKMSVPPVDKAFIKELKQVIAANIADPDFNVEELGKRLCMSRTTLYRKILALSGETPTEFIRSYRLKRGAELLKQESCSVLEVALDVGFSDATYFTKCFKKKFHQVPSEFRETKMP
jgi:signal transduction histidine kinase/DNA-binding NarL/FixJ family response regulator